MKKAKRINNKIKAMFAICLAIILIFPTGMNAYASPKEDTEASLRATKGDFYADQWVKWQDMMESYITYQYDNMGIYSVKKTKLYAREIIGLYEDGSYIIGPWKIVYTNTGEDEKVKIPGDCVMFAFSYDITWGTDFPYSGIFWNKPDERVNRIQICTWGEVRTPGINILVNKEKIYSAYNLPAHKEWQPS